MKNSGLIIKIAVGVSAVAALFSAVTLIRALIIGSSVVFPIIQVIGSSAIFAVCFVMFRMLSVRSVDSDGEELQEDESAQDESAQDESAQEMPQEDGAACAQASQKENDTAQAGKAVSETEKKYHLWDFEDQ